MKDRLHNYQYVFICVLFSAAGIFLPALVRNTVGTDAFLCFLTAFPLGLLNLYAVTSVYKKAKGPFNAFSRCFGKKAAKIVLAANSLYFTFSGALILAYFALYAAKGQGPYFTALFIIPTAIGICISAFSTSSLGRTAVIIGGMTAISAAVFFGASLINGRGENLSFPSFPSTGIFLNVTAVLFSLMFAECGAIVCLSGGLKSVKKLPRLTLISCGAAGAAVLIAAFLDIFLNGQTGAAYLSSYSDRFDTSAFAVLASAALFFASVFRASVCMRAAAVSISEAFNVKKKNVFVCIFSAFIAVISLILAKDMEFISSFILKWAWMPSIAIGTALPVLALICEKLVKRAKS